MLLNVPQLEGVPIFLLKLKLQLKSYIDIITLVGESESCKLLKELPRLTVLERTKSKPTTVVSK